MSALLKIVQGPNAGAEIALPDGVEITIGKADSCDIVLADPTLPDAPLKLSADASDGVTLDGTPLEPYHVRTLGSTALAVGPADAAWGELVWPKPNVEGNSSAPSEEAEEPATPVTPPPPPASPSNPKAPKRSWLRRLVILLILLFVLLIGFLFLAAALRGARRAQEYEKNAEAERAAQDQTLAALADRYNLTLDASSSRPVLSGNFATRADRLAATAEAYAARPGIELDLSDDETLKTAVDDTLALVGETGLSVVAVSNRVVILRGTANNLLQTRDALFADLPKLREIDTTAVTSPALPTAGTADTSRPARSARTRTSPSSPVPPALQVCGILSAPYPCLVLRNGTRIMEGSTVGDYTVVEIGTDSVTLTNAATGRLTWKP